MRKIPTTFNLPKETKRKLSELATQQKRSQAVILEILIDKEYGKSK